MKQDTRPGPQAKYAATESIDWRNHFDAEHRVNEALYIENSKLRAALQALTNSCDTRERNADGTQRGVRTPDRSCVEEARAAQLGNTMENNLSNEEYDQLVRDAMAWRSFEHPLQYQVNRFLAALQAIAELSEFQSRDLGNVANLHAAITIAKSALSTNPINEAP